MKKTIAKCAILISIVIGSWFNLAVAETILPPETSIFDETFGDLQEELLGVREENKKALMIMFETNDCPWCMRMKQTVLNRQRVQEYFKANFRNIILNAEGGAPITDFEGKETSETQFALDLLRVRATPVFAFFDTHGKLLTKFTGTTKNADDFLLLGRFVVEEHYKSERFSKFRRAKNAANAS